MRAGRNADGNAVVPRLALVLLAALVLVSVAHGAVPPPDSTFQTTLGGIKYTCQRWGAPPGEFLLHCVPKKKPTKGSA